jgi:hypothetical protein
MKKIFWAVAIVLFMGPFSFGAEKKSTGQGKGKGNGDVWNGILKANIDADGAVDYDQIRVNKGGDIYEYLAMIEKADITKMAEKDRAAFWINAYNAYVVKLILANSSLEKLSAADPIFEEKVKIANWRLSLNAIKNRVIRGDLAEGGPVKDLSLTQYNPLILFALCNGTVGSPSLHNQSFTGALLDEELARSAVQFINNPKNISIQDGKLKMSSLFDWYGKDFDPLGGVPAVIKTYLDSKQHPDAPQILELLGSSFPGNATFDFNWTLNAVRQKNP